MYKCNCKEWQKASKNNDYKYCPWCGKLLEIKYAKLYPRDYQHNAT